MIMPPANLAMARPLRETRPHRSTWPLFQFGDGANAAPLAIISGGLILDLGEAERTFIYRCQDRFLAYSSLWGLRSLFFVADDRHAATYRSDIAEQRRRFDRIQRRTGLFAAAPLLEPLYIGCDIDRMELFACSGLFAQLSQVSRDAGVALNQISPTYAALLAQLETLLRRQRFALETVAIDAARMATLAMSCADKADYLKLAAADTELPPHVPTALLSCAEISALADYDDLVSLYVARCGRPASPPQRLFVKATRNSAGNLAALLDSDNFDGELHRLRTTLAAEAACTGPHLEQQAATLRHEIDDAPSLRAVAFAHDRLRALKNDQARHRQGIAFLVQPQVTRNDRDFAGIGLSYMLGPHGSVTHICTNAQIYRDAEHKHFQGAYLSDSIGNDLPPVFARRMLTLCRRYAARGYVGPISFDARRSIAGQYELIYDCNPRLTGVFPSLAVRDALIQSGLNVGSVMTLGYRGEFVLPDLEAALAKLDNAGLLCTRDRGRGVVLLPNLCRTDGFDLHLINIEPGAARRLLAGPLATLSAASVHPSRLYF